MQKKVEQFMDKWGMITSEDTVITGVSGGADSVCLLVLLDEWRKKRGFRIYVVHVNHGIRGEAADQDEAYVRTLCKERNIPCEVVRADVPALAKEQKLSEEEVGRNVRREAFERVLREQHGTKIALAHHADDNAETFLWHLARGSKLKGLGGMAPVNGVYIRPLLCVERKEIERFLEERNIFYCMDATNLEDTYMRNRIRNHVIPYFQEHINEKTVEHVNAAMEYFREVQTYLEGEQRTFYQAMVETQSSGKLIKNTDLDQIPSFMRRLIIHQVLAEVAGQKKDLEEVHVVQVEGLLEKQTGKKLDLPYEMVAERTYEGVRIARRKKAEENLEEKELELTDGRSWDVCGRQISCRIFKNPGDMSLVPKKTFTKWFDYDIIETNVSIRARRTGDWIQIDEQGHTKKIKSFFVDAKIPSEERGKIPLLVKGSEVIWVVGYRQSKAFQVTEQTKTIVEIEIR